MKKQTVVLVIVALVIAFGALLYYGLTRTRGIPVPVASTKHIILQAPFVDKEIDLAGGLSVETWDTLSPTEIPLVYQVMVLPWGKSLVSPLTLKAFHNKNDIYFHLNWKDETPDKNRGLEQFTDACAVMLPFRDDIQPETLMMGFLDKVNIWHWKATRDDEFWLKKLPRTEAYSDYYTDFDDNGSSLINEILQSSAVTDLTAVRVGTVTRKDKQNVHGRGYWADGKWSVVFRRALAPPADAEIDAAFNPGQKRLCAFAVWNGATGDRGGRKSISDWVELAIGN